jgi:hypothetical protein
MLRGKESLSLAVIAAYSEKFFHGITFKDILC